MKLLIPVGAGYIGSRMVSHINVGAGSDVTIFELSQIVANVTGFSGRLTQIVVAQMVQCASLWTSFALISLDGPRK
ncbi:hypothetical protein N9M50_04225 [Alphaproteobacteria bacterium]|nr:hypothetical protein [Alphaproteobacteria bacterium]